MAYSVITLYQMMKNAEGPGKFPPTIFQVPH
jgi:hypothetical protein